MCMGHITEIMFSKHNDFSYKRKPYFQSTILVGLYMAMYNLVYTTKINIFI